jgi:uncharacterized membrane protein YphA (DoxX/SURF4 family)
MIRCEQGVTNRRLSEGARLEGDEDMESRRSLDSAWWALRIALGLVAFLAGLDKFFNILTDWSQYVSPLAERLLPISVGAFLGVIGIVEMLVGLAILTTWTRLGAYIAMVWLVGISLNLVLTGRFLDVAVRDLAMAIGAYTLARLTEARQPAAETRLSLTEALRTAQAPAGRVMK